MSICRLADYERIVALLRRAGATERELVRETKMRVHRIRDIAEWLIDHDIVRGVKLGTRQDPHDGSRIITILRYELVAPCPPEYLAARMRAHEKTIIQKRGSKSYDASALLACWGGVA